MPEVSSECLGHFWRAEVGQFWRAPKSLNEFRHSSTCAAVIPHVWMLIVLPEPVTAGLHSPVEEADPAGCLGACANTHDASRTIDAIFIASWYHF
jgi:hypothetical protein